MPEERGLYPQDTVRQTVEFYARLRHPRARRNEFFGEVVSSLGLDSLVGRRVGELSLGNQQRVQIAAALVCSQHCILWDEPFSGLDVEGVDALSDLLRSRKEEGVAVILSSHQLDVLERLCDRVTVIHAGRAESTTLGMHEGSREWEVTMPDGSVEAMPDTHEVRARLAQSMSWGGIFSLSQKNRTRMREFYDACSRRACEEE
jgi:ABC superfamily ATP binding cassette transporter, ABC protein